MKVCHTFSVKFLPNLHAIPTAKKGYIIDVILDKQQIQTILIFNRKGFIFRILVQVKNTIHLNKVTVIAHLKIIIEIWYNLVATWIGLQGSHGQAMAVAMAMATGTMAKEAIAVA